MKALIPFEAAARHLSIKDAADELCVVPAAVSHHLRNLEEWVGTPLFRRKGNSLEMTEAGNTYSNQVSGILDSLSEYSRAVQPVTAKEQLNVGMPPSFATKWFIPRLQRFRERFPEIDINVTVANSLQDCVHESMDISIHYDSDDYPNLYSCRLQEVKIFPVCRPHSMNSGLKPPERLSDLKHHTLIHDKMLKLRMNMDWPCWLNSAGAADLDIADGGLYFNRSALAYEAAIDGHGIALAKNVLVELDLRKGILIQPFEHTCVSGFSYSIVCRPTKAKDIRVIAFKEWLQEETELNFASKEPAGAALVPA